MKIWLNAVFKLKWRKTDFKKELYSMSGCDAKRIFNEKWWKFKETLFLTRNGAKPSFRETVVFHELIWCKTHLSTKNGKNLPKRCIQLKMEENTVFKKELFSMSRFDRKRIFQWEVVKNMAKHCFQPTMEQKTVFKKVLYSMSWFDAKPNFSKK